MRKLKIAKEYNLHLVEVLTGFKYIGEQIKLFEKMNESGNSSYYQLKNCYVSNEDEKLPRALNRVKEIDPTCYSRVHGGGFAGTMLMIVEKKKVNAILPILIEEFGKDNVMKVNLVEYGTTRWEEN